MKLAVPDLVSSSYFSAVAAVELGYFAREGLDVPPARHRHRLGIGGHSGLPSSESRRVRGPIDCSTSSSNPMMEGPLVPIPKRSTSPCDIDTAVADSLKVLDLKRPIREADVR